MLAYAANRRPAANTPHPKTLLLILAGHGAALFAVMTARGDIPALQPYGTTTIVDIAPDKPPPPPPPPPPPEFRPTTKEQTISRIDQPTTVIPIETPTSVGPVDLGPSTPNSGNGTATVPVPLPEPGPAVVPIFVAAHSLTRASDLIPTYPDDKLRMGEEASLQLRLAIGTDGRVTAVTPVGAADPSFLSAARRHILKRWHYAPATRGGTPVASVETVTIRFRLDA